MGQVVKELVPQPKLVENPLEKLRATLKEMADKATAYLKRM